MSLSRRNAKRDTVERAIIEALEATSAVVFQLSGAGVPDLLVGYRGRWIPLEVKSKTGTLTSAQVRTHGLYGYPIVRTPEEALQAIGVEVR